MKRLSGWGQLCARVVCACSVVLLMMMGLAGQAAAAPMVSAYSNSTRAVKSDGSLWTWGHGCCPDNYSGAAVLVGTGFDSDVQGHTSNVAIMADGSLWVWGNNGNGQLGNGTIGSPVSTLVPQRVGSGFKSVSTYEASIFAIKTDGSLWAWGFNLYGDLGDGGTTDVSSPKQIGADFEHVATGDLRTYAIKTDGSLWGWGDNRYGLLGHGIAEQVRTPMLLGSGYASVAVGAQFTLAIKTDGSLWAWGYNYSGQLGDGTTIDALTPKQIGTGFAKVAAGDYHALGIKSDGTLWAWGNNSSGQVGDGSTNAVLSPKQIGTGFTHVAAGSGHSVAIKTDGSLWVWGSNFNSQLGLGSSYTGGPEYALEPFQLFPSGFSSALSVTTAQPVVNSPQLLSVQLTLTNDQDTSLTFTPYLLEKDGIQYAPDAVDAANAVYEAPAADNTLKVKLAPVILAAHETRTLDVPIVIARPDLTDPAVATAMTVDFGVTTSDNRDVTATLNLNVSPRSEPAPASALLQRLSTGPVADMGVAPAALGANRAGRLAISTDLPSVNGDYWNAWVEPEMAKKPEGDEDRKFYLKLLRFGLQPREAYAVFYLRAIVNLKPEKAGKTGWFKLAKGSAQLWVEIKKARWGLTPDFNTPARNIFEGLDSVNALYFLNLLELSGSYSAPLVNAMSDNFKAFASTYTRTSQALCDYVQNGTLVSLPFPRMVEADLAYYMTSNGRWHPKIHHVLFDGVEVKGQDGQPQALSRFLEDFMYAYPRGDVSGCPIGGGQRNWVRIDVHSPLLPMVTDSQGRRFGIDAGGILHEEIPHAYIDPGHPWSMAVAAIDGALTIDYALAYPFDYGIEVRGLSNGIVTSEHVTRGTATANFSLKQQATVSNTAQSVSISMTNIVDNGSQTISFGAAPRITVGGTGTVSATATSGLAVSFGSTTLSVCTVSGSTVTGVSAGTCTIAADQAGNTTYAAAPQVTQNLTVSAPSTRLVNLSTRGSVQTGDNVMIGGFVIGGSTPKKVLIRAVGPNLANYGVTGVLADPTLQLFSGSTAIATNNDWQSASNAADIQATGLAPVNSKESAILTTLSPGAYTALVSGMAAGTGVGIVEVYELDNPASQFTNISTRGQVLTGDNVMIGGFVIQGDSSKTVLIRAVGPNLANYGVTGVLANPTLQLFSGSTMIANNDDWQTASNAAAIQATGLAPVSPLESAILITLPPGTYTAIVSGSGGAAGVGIVEVYAQ